MKRIVLILTLSLIMCLTMAFPASAAVMYVTGLKANYDAALKYAYWDIYTYKAYFMDKSNGLYVFAFTTPNPVNGSKYIYRRFENGALQYSSAVESYTNKVTYDVLNGGKNTMIAVNMTALMCYFEHLSTAKLNIKEDWYGFLTEIYVDTSALTALIAQAKAMQNTGYTQSSWNTFQIQINAAENLLAITGYTQEQINNMVNTLQTALDGLVLLPDTNELELLLADADAIEDIGYTTESWTRFANARSSARSLASSADYTQSELNYIVYELRTAMNGLTLNVITPPEQPKPPSSPLGYDLVSGDISGYLMPAPRLFYNYVRPVIPIALGLYAIYFSIRLIPRLGRIILRTLRR